MYHALAAVDETPEKTTASHLRVGQGHVQYNEKGSDVKVGIRKTQPYLDQYKDPKNLNTWPQKQTGTLSR